MAVDNKYLIIPIFIIFSILTFFSFSLYAQQDEDKKETGKIGEFEAEVEEQDSSGEKSSGNSKDDSWFNVFFFVNSVDDLLLVPRLFIGSFPGEDSLIYKGNFWDSNYSEYPYYVSSEGLYSTKNGKRFSVILSGHYFYNSSILQGISFRGRLSPIPYLNFDIHYNDLTEKLRTRYDHLRLYDVYLNYNRVRQSRLTMWWGLGLKGMQGDNRYNSPAFNTGMEVYPFNPVSVHFNYNIGSVNGQGVSSMIVHGNFHLGRNIFYVGYQRFTAGSSVMDGAILGAGIYF